MALDSRIVLLVGADTSIVDESSYARTLTAAGGAARTTGQFKYGTASITFDGTGDWVQAADSVDFTFGSGDFTVEGWFRFQVKTDNQALMGHWDNFGGSANSSWFLFISGGTLIFRDFIGGSSHDLTYSWVPTLGTWYHVAVDRSGSTLRIYINGSIVATNSSFSGTLTDSTHPFTLGAIGSIDNFPSFDFNGQMDEIRITKGLAQYNGAFTAPTAAFPRTDPTIARVTQFPVEVLSLPVPDARVTQFPVEILSLPFPDARVTQYSVEILSANVAAVVSTETTQFLIVMP